jgi:hypothetical protein
MIGPVYLAFIIPPSPWYHRFTRTLSQWMNMLTETGLLIERVEEPRPTDETVRECPDVQDAQVVAYFLHVRARKPV